MLLRRFTDKSAIGAGLLALLVLAACGGPGPVRDAQAPQERTGEPVAGAAETVLPDAPPEVLTRFEQATAVMAAGDMVDAELRFEEFVLMYPDYPGAWVNLAIIYTGNGDDEAARQALDSALAINPNHAVALNQMGMLLRRNGNFLEAEAAYLKAVTVSPDYALAHYNLGVLNELYLQRLEAALHHFETYQSLVGEDKQVEKWISDLKRRVAASQQTANVAE
ncbi:MAG TPA: tetratricopeptide repeat protein [Woeseiaceae bacterium]|jgi:Flp pilus assembly protein TadD|nr:tetratricopeptide repeat protein [Woeseiaceae bacterium]